MSQHIFTIITVCKNDIEALKNTWQSLKNQTRHDLIEWIVIDGASNDGTPEFLISLSSESFKPAFWSSKDDSGLYDAMNKGIEIANAHYIMFLNAGDLLADEITMDFLVHTVPKYGADFAYGDSFEQIADGEVHIKPARSHEQPELGLFTHHQAMIYKREAIDDLRYDTRYKIAADYDFTLRFLQKTNSVHYLPEPLCIFAAGGISQQMAKLGRREQYDIRKALNLTTPTRNKMIYCMQVCNFMLRRFFPFVYWRLKKNA